MEAKHRGLIPEIKALVDAWTNHGFHIANDLYVRVLEAAQEQKP
jgi:predicted nucleic acid-binding protein